MRRQADVLLVDGYNMIGTWPKLVQLKDIHLEDARDQLLEMLAEYQGFTGMAIYVVFDAHQVPGLGASFAQFGLHVIYTKEKETADACIERLASELAQRSRNLYVATSDMAEQNVTFGKGALRIPARELLVRVEQVTKQIGRSLDKVRQSKRNEIDEQIAQNVRLQLEKMRRGQL